ncbi:hypothetical protein B0H14DRAFT_3178725, partial [Mycena olivaceomarginata]
MPTHCGDITYECAHCKNPHSQRSRARDFRESSPLPPSDFPSETSYTDSPESDGYLSSDEHASTVPDLEVSDTLWADPEILSFVRIGDLRVTTEVTVQRMEYLTEFASLYPIPDVATAFVIYAEDPRFHQSGLCALRVPRVVSRISGDSSTARTKLTAAPVSGSTLAAANLSPTLPTTSLLNITRRWLLFDVTNSQTVAVEIGLLGAPLEFNHIFTGLTSTQTNTICSLSDPYIGADAAFVQ